VTNRGIARAGLVVTAAFLASRLLGWVRLVVIGNVFGKDPDLAAYFTAFRIPDLIYQLVAAGAIASALIPVLASLLADGTPSRAWRVASTVGNLILVALLVLATIVLIWAPELVPFLFPGQDAHATEVTVQLTRIMVLAPIFLALGAVASAILNTQGRFGVAAMGPVMFNLAIIVFAFVLGPTMGIQALAIGTVVGAFLHFAIQVPMVRRLFTYHPRIDLRDEAARKSLWLMLPRAIGLGITQITFLVNISLATSLGPASVVAYTVAFTILQIPLGLVGFPLGVVLLPSLSRAMAEGRMADFAQLMERSIRLVLWLTLVLSTVGIVLATPTVTLLFGSGSFPPETLALTATTLAWFLLGLPAHSLNVVLTRAFYSAQDTRTPVVVAIGSVVVNVAVSVATVGTMGLSGLALGIALGGWFEAVVLSLLLWRRTHAVPLRPVVVAGLVSLVGALIAAAVAYVVLQGVESWQGIATGRLDALVQLAVVGPISLASYLLYSRLMRIPELSQSIRLFRSAVHRG
jgi:putative peptidoglycan lipid II flippase